MPVLDVFMAANSILLSNIHPTKHFWQIYIHCISAGCKNGNVPSKSIKFKLNKYKDDKSNISEYNQLKNKRKKIFFNKICLNIISKSINNHTNRIIDKPFFD